MQIAVLSDLHLGRKNALDQFYRNPDAEHKLNRLLIRLEKSVDKIVLLGDIFETLRGKFPGQASELKRILKKYPFIARKIMEDPRYFLIQGNHDLATGKILNARETLIIKDGGTSICFFHGHQVDSWYRSKLKTFLCNIGIWAGGRLEVAGMDVTRGGNIISKLKSQNNEWVAGDFEEASIKFANKRGCDVAVTGHSHHPMKVEFKDGLFLNSGTWVAGREDLVMIDTSVGLYEVHKRIDNIVF